MAIRVQRMDRLAITSRKPATFSGCAVLIVAGFRLDSPLRHFDRPFTV